MHASHRRGDADLGDARHGADVDTHSQCRGAHDVHGPRLVFDGRFRVLAQLLREPAMVRPNLNLELLLLVHPAQQVGEELHPIAAVGKDEVAASLQGLGEIVAYVNRLPSG